MTTNTLQKVPAPVHSVSPAVKVLRIAINFADGATNNYLVGTIPAGSVVSYGGGVPRYCTNGSRRPRNDSTRLP